MLDAVTRVIRRKQRRSRFFGLDALHIDLWLVGALCVIMLGGLVVLYSAAGESTFMVEAQALRFAMALVLMIAIAQIPPSVMVRWTPLIYVVVVALLVAVAALGYHAMGAQRWLIIPGIGRFQPSELMKIVMPLTLATYLSRRSLPLSWLDLLVCLILLMVPVALIMDQPDLGTAMLVTFGGCFVILFAGISWRLIGLCVLVIAAALPLLWFNMYDYQQQRVMTFLSPETDPLGAGWNIIQSKTAIGSGGIFGKGWTHGSQSHLQFLPESHTDFIVAVLAEEFGLVGVCLLLFGYLVVVFRGMILASRAQDTFGRLAAGSLALIFFIYVVVNIGMVSGLMPVVGVPLPLISYGGTASVTLLAGFGILMSIGTQRRLVSR
ncbi:rod shape-determining protein RodA [Carnimonas nigrificans]|uniref:rod shape-determining protein RodA n=1 Tax=Carnimonas nigrificans TaxID=64323 RepID=UPI00046EC8E0|nr:rod shape-determining protein RodA [Carnimonas nigrificans]